MKTTMSVAAIAALVGNAFASPVATATMFNPIVVKPLTTASPTAPAPTCTTNVFINPVDNGPTCTFYAATSTFINEIECGGCATVTRQLGFGMPCQSSTTLQETTTVFETACATPAGIIVPPNEPVTSASTTTTSS